MAERYRPATEEERRILEAANAQARPYTDPRADYPPGNQARRARAEGNTNRTEPQAS